MDHCLLGWLYPDGDMMRFRNPFKRRKTVAEPIEDVRPVVQAFGTPEAYVSYEFEHDHLADRPDRIIPTHPFVL